MSKIQKALNALRDSRGSGSGVRSDREHGSADHKKHQAGLRHRNARKESPSAKQRTFDISLEPHPEHRIDVDTAQLQKAGLIADDDNVAAIAQQFRRIKRPIIQCAFELPMPAENNANVVMVASATPGVGKSFCSFNLAQSIASERDVGAVLVDADVLKPGISHHLGLKDHVGLIDYLVDPDIAFSDILVATNINGIIVIPAGRRHPEATELLASRRMQEFVETLAEKFSSRVIVFDTPPLLVTSEAQVLAERMGQIALIIEARVSLQEPTMRALELLDRDKPINAILNKSRSASGGGYYGDDYGYYPYPQHDEESTIV